jgi:hypothetical protein
VFSTAAHAALQYLLSGSAGQVQFGCAHFLAVSFAILVSFPHKVLPSSTVAFPENLPDLGLFITMLPARAMSLILQMEA